MRIRIGGYVFDWQKTYYQYFIVRPRDRENSRYRHGFKNQINRGAAILIDTLRDSPRGKVLDIGCGIGTHASVLKSLGFSVVGIDFSSVATSRAYAGGIETLEVDADEGLPFANDSFDYVWATDVLEHVFDPVNLVKEVFRVLCSGGRFLLTVPNGVNFKIRWTVLLTGRSPQSKIYRRLGQCKHHTIFSLELLDYMLREQGGFNISFIHAVSPRMRFVLKNAMLASLMGGTFVVLCHKI